MMQCSSSKIMFFFRSYDAIVGVTSQDWFHAQGADALEKGISKKEKEKFLRSYILNNYENHLKEIFLVTNNEYSELDKVTRWLFLKVKGSFKYYIINFRQFLDPHPINYVVIIICIPPRESTHSSIKQARQSTLSNYSIKQPFQNTLQHLYKTGHTVYSSALV